MSEWREIEAGRERWRYREMGTTRDMVYFQVERWTRGQWVATSKELKRGIAVGIVIGADLLQRPPDSPPPSQPGDEA